MFEYWVTGSNAWCQRVDAWHSKFICNCNCIYDSRYLVKRRLVNKSLDVREKKKKKEQGILEIKLLSYLMSRTRKKVTWQYQRICSCHQVNWGIWRVPRLQPGNASVPGATASGLPHFIFPFWHIILSSVSVQSPWFLILIFCLKVQNDCLALELLWYISI